MVRPLANLFSQLDHAYQDRPYLFGMKAKLLAGIAMVFLVVIPLNLIKLALVGAPHIEVRLAFNLIVVLAAWFTLSMVRRGRADAAGGALVLLLLVPTHGMVFLAQRVEEPLALALQLFAFDMLLVLLAFVFATRIVALVVAGLVLIGHILTHAILLRARPMPGSLEHAGDSLLREGLIMLVMVGCVAFTVRAMIEAAYRRSEDARKATQATNNELERLVALRTKDLESAMRKAESALQVKSEFLANMSHEIRTPLNGVVATADLLRQRRDLPEAIGEEVRLIAESGELLQRLLDDILDFSKIEAGQILLEARAFELEPLVADCVGLIGTRAASGGVSLKWITGDNLPARWIGDGFRIRQVLLNLLSNAVKFTPPEGLVSMQVHAAPGGLYFEVTDTGIGMDGVTRARLFERFTQADSSTTRTFGGTGLGLAISARLVELMGGRLEVESALGRGSRFHFTLPLQPTTTPGTPLPPADDVSPIGLHVMVVEDNPVNMKIITSQLKSLGCRYSVAHDGQEALAVFERGEALPDLVLMDCHMPKMDGWEVTRRIRSWRDAEDPGRRAAARLPIIALTAAALVEERKKCLEAGMNDFLAKPARLRELRRVLCENAPAPSTLRSG